MRDMKKWRKLQCWKFLRYFEKKKAVVEARELWIALALRTADPPRGSDSHSFRPKVVGQELQVAKSWRSICPSGDLGNSRRHSGRGPSA